MEVNERGLAEHRSAEPNVVSMIPIAFCPSIAIVQEPRLSEVVVIGSWAIHDGRRRRDAQRDFRQDRRFEDSLRAEKRDAHAVKLKPLTSGAREIGESP